MTDTQHFTAVIPAEPEIPTAEHELVEFMETATDAAVNAMYDRLVAKLGQDPADVLWRGACREMDHDSDVAAAISELTDATARAIRALFEAQAALYRLREGDAWHAEYNGTGPGEDIEVLLSDARRFATAAQALHRQTAGS